VVLLIWVYYSAQIFLLGAEFTWVYANAHGSRRGQQESRQHERGSERAGPAREPRSATS
jgi:membrane protein